MFPEIPADLSALTPEQLAALEAECVTFATEARAGAITDETITQLGTVAEGVERVRSELTTRATAEAERQTQLAALADRIAPVAETPPADEPEPAPTETPTTPVTTTTTVPTPAAPPATPQQEGAPATADQAIAASATPARRTPPTLPALPSQRPAETVTIVQPIRPTPTILASADIPGIQSGSELDFRGMAEAIIRRREGFGRVSTGTHSENVIVASVHANYPEERTLRAGQDGRNMGVIRDVTSPQAITAAGGLCAPVQPYYQLMVLAGAQRPVRDGLAGFGADRGGVRYVPPPQLSDVAAAARTVADGATTSGSATVTSATAAFDSRDVGAAISGTGIPAGAYIVSVTNATTVVISANATATGTGVSITITRRGTVGIVTAAQDAAALNGTAAQVVAGTKPCIHVSCPAAVEVLLQAISRCLRFGNFAARAFPEQVEAWLALATAQWARRAETALLDRISANSTQVTAASQLGTARDLVRQVIKAAAYYRNRNRMDPDAVLRLMIPSYAIDAAAADLVAGSGYDSEFFNMARAMVLDAIDQANVRVTTYLDSGTGKGQLINSGNVQGAGALTTFPTTVVWYLFAEGSFLFLDGGTLDFGLVRDSSLNALNDYTIMAESFEELAFVGIESLEVTSTVVANGSYAPAAAAITAF